MEPARILVVRFGAMGDVLHAMPAVATLRRKYPAARISWAVHPKWRDLLEGGGLADELIFVNRRSISSLSTTWRQLRRDPFDLVFDFQGLIQSAVVSRLACSKKIYGFHVSQAREKAAAFFYTNPVLTQSAHVVDRNLEIAAAAGAKERVLEFLLPAGRPEGSLPQGRYVLASPVAGWTSKQWPLEHYALLARRVRHELGAPLVLNGAPSQESMLHQVPGAEVHVSSVAGLIDATRNAAAVLGVDSGPMHLAAALGIPGVALFGPTDPARNGPYSSRITVLRSQGAHTTYQRGQEIDESLRGLTPDQVFAALKDRL